MNFRTLLYSVGCFATCLHAALLCESLPHQDTHIQDSSVSENISLLPNEDIVISLDDVKTEIEISPLATTTPVETESTSQNNTNFSDNPHKLPEKTVQNSTATTLLTDDIHDSITVDDIPEITEPSLITATSVNIEPAHQDHTITSLVEPSKETTQNIAEFTSSPHEEKPKSEDFEDLLALLASEQPHQQKVAEITTETPVEKIAPTPQITSQKSISATEQKKARLLTAIENRSKKNQSGIRKSPLFNLTSRPQQTSPQFAMPHQPGALEQFATNIFYTLLSAIVGGFATQHGTDFVSNWWTQWNMKPEDVTKTNIAKSNIGSIIKDDQKNTRSLEEIIDFIVNQTIERWNWKHLHPKEPYPTGIELHPDKPFFAIQFKGAAGAGKSYMNRVMYGEIHERLINSTKIDPAVPRHKGVAFFEYTLQSFTSKWKSGGEEKIRAAFNKAQEAQAEGYLAAIFFDEAHGFNGDGQSSGNTNNASNQDIIQQFKSCVTNGKYTYGIMISSATDQEIVDKAIERRLGTWYYVNDFKKKDYGSYLLSLLTKKWPQHSGLTIDFANKACNKLPNEVPMDTLFRLSEEIHQTMYVHNGDMNKTLKIADEFSKKEVKRLRNHSNALKALYLAPSLLDKTKLIWYWLKKPYTDNKNLGTNILNNPLPAVGVLALSALEKPLTKVIEKSEPYINNGWNYFNGPTNKSSETLLKIPDPQ